VDGRPVSSITTRFLSWCCGELEAAGKRVLLLIWDNASWHISKEARRWLGKHNRNVKCSGGGVRIVSCLLPKQSLWLNAIEPKWVLMGSARSWNSTVCWEPTSWPTGYAGRSDALITSISPFPKRSLDHALSTFT
jgi:hypothetical protein